jgi:hypothetical protein
MESFGLQVTPQVLPKRQSKIVSNSDSKLFASTEVSKMRSSKSWWIVWLVAVFLLGCSSGSDTQTDGDSNADGDVDADGDQKTDGDAVVDGDADGDVDVELDTENEVIDGDATESDGEDDPAVTDLLPPPEPADTLGYDLIVRETHGDAPTAQEITAFTKKVTGFFKDTDYWNWVWRTSHGLDASYNSEMFDYKMWWQDCGMRKEGDSIVFFHTGRAENITKRTVKVMDNAIAGHLMTGDARMAEIATQLLKGIVALSLGLEFESEDPIVKYLQARAVFNHNHSYEVDDRAVGIDYEPMYTPSFKWNVHVFEIIDNPTYGNIWVSNMRSKDDVPYLFLSLPIVTRAYYESKDKNLREAARLYIEYIRGFSQSIVDNDWFILTKYSDGVATIQIDATREGNPPADLGSFVHWIDLFGPDAECNAQLGAALTGYGVPMDKGDCDGGQIGNTFERMATNTNYFNHNIYNYFHVAALATAQLWGKHDIAASLMEGLVIRYEKMMYDENVPNRDHKEFQSDYAGWLLAAAAQGYPLTGDEAHHIIKLYGESSDWYRQWPHWDPWQSLSEGQQLSDYKAPRDESIDDGQGGTIVKTYVRLVEMPYVFEYCYSPLRSREGVQFIDCEIVADPNQWGED